MAIAFNQIPNNVFVPGNYVEIDNRRAVRGLLVKPFRLLVLGQQLSTATATANTLTPVSSIEQAVLQFGRGSNLAHLVKVIKTENPYVELTALPVADNGAGVAATGTIAVAVTTALAGTLNLYIAGERVQVAVAAGDAANTIATSINAAINANGDLPVTATVSTNTVTLTARHKGEIGNDIKVVENWAGAPSEVTPAGVTLTITQLASGATNPVLTTAIANIDETIYDGFITPWNDTTTLNAFKTEIDSRWEPITPLEGHAFGAYRGTYANQLTFASGRNNPHECVMGLKSTAHIPAYLLSAAFAAAYASVVQAKDVATPVRNVALKSFRLKKSDEFTFAERNILLQNGIATYTVGNDGTVYLERSVTTYKTNPAGATDRSYLDATTMFTTSYLRQDWKSLLDQRYYDYKAADDDTPPTAPRVVRPKDLRADAIGRFRLWQQAGLVENIEQFKADSRFERSTTDPGRINTLLAPNLTNGLQVIGTQIQFVL